MIRRRAATLPLWGADNGGSPACLQLCEALPSFEEVELHGELIDGVAQS
jgi:hypothetical protein